MAHDRNASENRILFNADCNTYVYDYPEGTNAWQQAGSRHGELAPQAIQAYVDLIARSGVDTFVYNPCAQRAWWPSKTTPTAWDGYRRGDQAFFYGHVLGQAMTQEQLDTYLRSSCRLLDRYLDLLDAGADLLAETSRACRRRGIAPWLSARMNDMHGANWLEGSYMNAPLLAHPEFRLAGRSLNDKAPPRRSLQALNYQKREVRDYMLTMLRELIEDYDFEGLELDWTRHLFCCNPVASQQTIDTITAWHAELAALCQRKAKATGRPFRFGVRCAANLADQRHLGLDVVAMAHAGFLDFVCPTRAGVTTTWDLDYHRLRLLLGERVKLYGVIEFAPNWLPAYAPKHQHRHYLRYLPASAAMLRGNAAGKLAAGADGIEIFNFFAADQHVGRGAIAKGFSLRADYPAIRGVADLKTLRGKPKFYAFSAGFENWGVRTTLEVDEQLPQYFEPTTQRRFHIPMCAESAKLELTVQVVFEKPAGAAALPEFGVSFNDSWPNWNSSRTDALLTPVGDLTHHAPENTALNFRFPASAIREGWNELVLAHGGSDPGEPAKRREQGVRVVGIELLVHRARAATGTRST